MRFQDKSDAPGAQAAGAARSDSRTYAKTEKATLRIAESGLDDSQYRLSLGELRRAAGCFETVLLKVSL